jgi:hypothetical protein
MGRGKERQDPVPELCITCQAGPGTQPTSGSDLESGGSKIYVDQDQGEDSEGLKPTLGTATSFSLSLSGTSPTTASIHEPF